MQGSSEDRPGSLAAYLSQHGSDSFAHGISGAVRLLSLGRELDLPRQKALTLCRSTTEHRIVVGCRSNL